MNSTRRHFLKKVGTALLLIPLLDRQANAASNATVRAQLQYRNTPKDGMNCTTCLEFLPGKSDQDLGGCKLMPGDDEISPNGYCTKWNSM
jgi:hypothetical protein